jgi:hypothetical protein
MLFKWGFQEQKTNKGHFQKEKSNITWLFAIGFANGLW